MKTKRYLKLVIAGISALVLAQCIQPLPVAGKEKALRLEIEDIEIVDNVYTPYYNVDTGRTHQQGADKRWIKLIVEFETAEKWIDDLTVRYQTISRAITNDVPVILAADVDYINVGPGDHSCAVYMHHSYVRRYEIDETDLDFSVEFFIDGKRIAHRETHENFDKGWSLTAEDEAAVHRGHLLDHTETPFWFVNYDFKEIVKRYSHKNVE